MELKKAYNELGKKYNLPEFKLVEFEFELDPEEEAKFPLRTVRKKISEKIESFCKILEEILQPDTSLSGLHECKFFDESKKKELYELYKRLMVINRHALQLSIHNIEKDDAKFIDNVIKQWDDIKNNLSDCIKNVKENWEKESDIKEDLGYLG